MALDDIDNLPFYEWKEFSRMKPEDAVRRIEKARIKLSDGTNAEVYSISVVDFGRYEMYLFNTEGNYSNYESIERKDIVEYIPLEEIAKEEPNQVQHPELSLSHTSL